MLYELLYPLKDLWFGFNIFRYITFRASMAAVTSFVICLVIGPFIINWLKALNAGQFVRKEHVDSIYDLHKDKEGTPTMGGILIIASVLVSSLMWCRLNNDYVILVMAGMVWMGAIGFIDDMLKMRNKSSKGLHAAVKIAGQAALALIVGIFVVTDKNLGTDLYVPFLKNAVANLGLFYIIFILLVIAGTSNAVNLTDGLDGLAIGCVVFITLTYSVICYVAGRVDLAGYLQIFYLPGAGELTVFLSALTGAGLGFLWYNSHPASIFMGDTGSLSLGGTIAIVSVLVKKELLLLIVGGVLVVEALSVILQVMSFKVRKKRIFLISPVHHHFQARGLHESKITARFWIVAAILSMLAMATLKAR
jgi:phospho-N-acetylmuramoyl-pentapeptide-transferase